MNGPAAFLIAFGASVALLGALMFLAIPAANRLDAKEEDKTGVPVTARRTQAVIRSANIGLGTGLVLVSVGLALRKRT